MLVLSRKKGEKLVIGNAVVTVKWIRGNRVQIGIEAPREIPVKRLDKDNNKAA